MAGFPVSKSDSEWRAELSPEEYRMLRMQGTEAPGRGEYHKFFPKEGYVRAQSLPESAAGARALTQLGSLSTCAVWLSRMQASALQQHLQVQGLWMGRIRPVLLLRGRWLPRRYAARRRFDRNHLQQLRQPPRPRVLRRAPDVDGRAPLSQLHLHQGTSARRLGGCSLFTHPLSSVIAASNRAHLQYFKDAVPEGLTEGKVAIDPACAQAARGCATQ